MMEADDVVAHVQFRVEHGPIVSCLHILSCHVKEVARCRRDPPALLEVAGAATGCSSWLRS